jgi:hypothetical protein
MIFNYSVAYIGSANLTGAGMGTKSERERNFEAGILTDIPKIVVAAAYQFDSVWIGTHYKTCGRKDLSAISISFSAEQSSQSQGCPAMKLIMSCA